MNESLISFLFRLFLIESFSKVRAMQNSSEIFFASFLYHLVECELLVTKNNFLPYTNIFFRSKNLQNSKDVRFFKKHIFSKICLIFCFVFSLCFCKHFFQILHVKLRLDKLLNQRQIQNSISSGALNLIECTTSRSIL